MPTISGTNLQEIAKALTAPPHCIADDEIAAFLDTCLIPTASHEEKGWRELFEALREQQHKDGHRRSILAFIRVAMKPERNVGDQNRFEGRRTVLNQVLAECGLEVGSDGDLKQSRRTLVEQKRPAWSDASQTTGADPQPTFRIGSVLGQSFSTAFRNVVPFVILALIVTSPPFLYQLLALDPVEYGGNAIVTIADLIFPSLVTATVVYGTVQDLRGRHASITASIARGLPRLFPVILVTIVMWIAIGLASLLLIIPGLFVATITWVAVPVAVVEKPGIFASLARSTELTRGNRWRVFALLIIATLLLSLISGLIGGVIGFIWGISPTSVLAIEYAGGAVGVAFTSVVVAVTYYQLRVAHDGVDIDQIAAVFD